MARLASPLLTVVAILPLVVGFATGRSWAQGLTNGGFEVSAPGGLAPGWQLFESGYLLDGAVSRSGHQSIRCENADTSQKRGALYAWNLDQKRALPVEITGWSRAAGVSGGADGDYSIYIDVQYTDGTYQWGLTAPFATGTHDWQIRRLRVTPARPIRTLNVYALFRNHSGTAWFDDFSATVVSDPFDGQAVAPPSLPATLPTGSGMWFARDVSGGSRILPLCTESVEGKTGPPLSGEHELGLHLNPATDSHGVLRATLENQTDQPRAVTLYYVERFGTGARSASPLWWDDIRHSRAAVVPGEYANLVPLPNTGAVEAMSRYPWACLSQPGLPQARMLAVPPDLGPRVARIAYNAQSRLYYVAFDLALPPRKKSPSLPTPPVSVAVGRYNVDPAWGFRAATAEYYRRFPQAFVRRAHQEGIWVPFTAPASISQPADFGFAFHEGDSSVASDDRLGILSFHYTEPMTYWQSLAPSVPRTYEAAIAKIRADAAAETDSEARRTAQAVLLSGSYDESGTLNVQFRNMPWSNGAVWALNPNPRLPHPKDQWTKARVNYSEDEQKRFHPGTAEGLDGEYLDSIEAYADTLDYRPGSLAATTLPLTFATDTHRAVLPTWFSVYEYTDYLSRDLHNRSKLLMGNSALDRIWNFAPPLDIMGIETNWNSGEGWHPDPDAVFNFRRTLSYHKPYLLLQNTEYDKFDSDKVERYFRVCLFYGVFPSMFSADASNHPYWENPLWYNRDRALFRRYIPIIRDLSAAGWEPITEARSSDQNVYVERYGDKYLTLRNISSSAVKTTLTLDDALIRRRIGFPKPARLTLTDVLAATAAPLTVKRGAAGFQTPLSLEPDEVRVLRLTVKP